MTLKEKFNNELGYDKGVIIPEKLEEIADDYAIEFAEWLYKWDNTRLQNGNWIIGLGLKPLISKEVLERFKKEKGWI